MIIEGLVADMAEQRPGVAESGGLADKLCVLVFPPKLNTWLQKKVNIQRWQLRLSGAWLTCGRFLV